MKLSEKKAILEKLNGIYFCSTSEQKGNIVSDICFLSNGMRFPMRLFHEMRYRMILLSIGPLTGKKSSLKNDSSDRIRSILSKLNKKSCWIYEINTDINLVSNDDFNWDELKKITRNITLTSILK